MSKYNPSAPRISGTLGKTSTGKSAEHFQYSGLRKEQKNQSREEHCKAKIELEYRKIRKS